MTSWADFLASDTSERVSRVKCTAAVLSVALHAAVILPFIELPMPAADTNDSAINVTFEFDTDRPADGAGLPAAAARRDAAGAAGRAGARGSARAGRCAARSRRPRVRRSYARTARHAAVARAAGSSARAEAAGDGAAQTGTAPCDACPARSQARGAARHGGESRVDLTRPGLCPAPGRGGLLPADRAEDLAL